ncbi:MAG: FlgO family outer membrane protein [bacterium]
MKRKALSVLFLILILTGAYAMWNSYRRAARDIAEAASRQSRKRIAVLAFSSETGSRSKASAIVTERLTTEMASRPEVEMVEREKLNEVLKEQGIQARGVVDSRTASAVGAVLGVDAVVTGTVIDLGNGNVEMNARLVDTQSARVLKAVNHKMTKDWESVPSPWSDLDLNYDTLPPVPIIPDSFFMTQDNEPLCHRLSGQEYSLLDMALEIKAKGLALGLKNHEIDIKKLRANPGSDIADPQIRALFYSKVKDWYGKPSIPVPTENEKHLLETASAILKLPSLCDR